jgi:hypothetical protein
LNGVRCTLERSLDVSVIAGEEIGARDSCEGHDFPFLAIVKFDKTSTFRLMADAI